MIMTFLFVPIFILLSYSKEMLVALGQNEEVAGYAYLYIMTFLPGLYLSGLNDCQRKLLNNFGKNRIVFYSSFISCALHGFWCYIYIVLLDLEIVGTGLAQLSS